MTGVELGEAAQAVEVRIRLRVAGDELLGQWTTLPAESALREDDDLRQPIAESLGRAMRDGKPWGLPLPGGQRWVSGRHVEWFEVEVRRR